MALVIPGNGIASKTGDQLLAASRLIHANQDTAALTLLKEFTASEVSEDRKALAYFAKGKLYLKMKRYQEGVDAVNESLRLGHRIPDIAHYVLGQLYVELGDLKKAEKSFLETLRLKPNIYIRNKAYFELGKLFVKTNRHRQARYYMRRLERRIRGTERHPEVLWNLIQVENKLRRKWKACAYAKTLYWKYPAHPLVYDWGIDLQANKVKGKRLGCVASPRVQKKRIRRLQYSGESDRALNEIKTLQKRVGKSTKYLVDSMMANFLINEGHVQDALKILLGHYKTQERNKDYLMLLAKASSRAGEFQTAVGAYHKVHKLRQRSRLGRKALFQAAFLSYQFQDYDGAGRKFSEFIKKYRRSGLSRDSRWHLAWIKYLKKDYEGANVAFTKLLKDMKRYRRRWRNYSKDRIHYWKAMSLYRLDRLTEAKPIFEMLASDQLYGYYSVASRERLRDLKVKLSELNLREIAQENNKENKDVSAEGDESVINAENQSKKVSEEDESEETLAEEQDSDDENSDIAEEDTVAEVNEVDLGGVGEDVTEEEVIIATNFKDPRLSRRFERARDLKLIGMDELAHWELYEIERRTSNADYRKMLMAEYRNLGSYHRSAYIGGIYFSNQRRQYGMEGIRYLWEYTYPRAYRTFVENYSKTFGVNQNFIWSIMRAETHYRKEAVSSVGALGLMQIMPYTGRQVARLIGIEGFAVTDLLKPETNVRLGTRYLNRLLKKYNNKIPLAAASYNAGPHRVHSWLYKFGNLDMDEFVEHIPFLQTRNYVKKVIRFNAVYSNLYEGNSNASSWLSKSVDTPMTEPPPTRETWETL